MKTKQIYQLYQQSYKVTIDSRKITQDCLYFAFEGTHVDGNAFAQEAIEKGALACFVEKEEYAQPERNIYLVKNTLKKLQKLAKYHRKKIMIPVVALTGSNGKTTTKELMSVVMNTRYKTLYTEGNLNNHLGVPLSLLRIDPTYEFAIIEMGANHQKEIAELSKLARPDIGYITNFGKAHLEGFGGEEGVIAGKSELYDFLQKHHKRALINEADPIQKKKAKRINKTITFGKPQSNYYFELIEGNQNRLCLSYKNTTIQTQLTGDYNFSNASAAISLGLFYDIDISKIKKALESYIPENKRSQVIEQGGKNIVLDAYNANPSSMKAALENFKQFEGSKAIVLGDMLELGDFADTEHRHIIELAQDGNFETMLFVGENFYRQKNEAALFFKTKEELETFLAKNPIIQDNILIKASRGLALETIVEKI